MRIDRGSDSNEILTRRGFLLLLLKFTGFAFLASRAIYLQLFQSKKYKTLSDQNRISIDIILPTRGQIFDSNNNLLVSNKYSFNLILNKNQNKDFTTLIQDLCQLIPCDSNMQEILAAKIKKTNNKGQVVLLRNLSWQEVVKISENLYRLPNLEISKSPIRFYHHSFILSHVLGYMGQINAKEKEELDLNYSGELSVGKSGIEKFYENQLRGNFGWAEIETNAFGKNIRELSNHSSTAGENCKLTIDIDLQQYISGLFEGLVGTVVVSDNTNGNILSLFSSPNFDPNQLINKPNIAYWQQMHNNTNNPLLNRAIQSTYPPGSVFKIVTILAALIKGVPSNTVFNCNGFVNLGAHVFRCANRNGHGPLNMKESLIRSCNCYMYNIGKLIGHEPIVNTARLLGFGVKTNLNLPFEVSGFVGDNEWKKKRFKHAWTLGDTYNLSIGQGFLGVTALQLINLISYVANLGSIYEPRLSNIGNMKQIETPIPKEFLEFVRDALYGAVNDARGTAYSSKNYDLRHIFGGKTGTAQVRAKKNKDDDLSRASALFKHRNHGLFVGFNVGAASRRSVAIIVEHGGSGGGAAAPIASKIFQQF
jgi:penicillin-binding protein 2